MMDWDEGHGSAAWVAGSIMMLVILVCVITAGYLLVAMMSARNHTPEPPAPRDALRLLDERLARGEIDAEDYRQRRELLTGSDSR